MYYGIPVPTSSCHRSHLTCDKNQNKLIMIHLLSLTICWYNLFFTQAAISVLRANAKEGIFSFYALSIIQTLIWIAVTWKLTRRLWSFCNRKEKVKKADFI